MELFLLHYPFTCLFVVFLVLYQVKPAFRFFCKMTFYKLWFFTISIGVVILSVPRGRNVENATAEGCNPVSRATLSADDDLSCPRCPLAALMEILPHRCVPIAKREILYMGTFGLACWLVGTIFIDRKDREGSINTLTEVARSLHKDNLRVLIFPEGTRNHGGSMLPFKRGAFQLAVKAQVPIIPVVFSSYNSFYNQKEKRFTPGKLIIQVLPEVETLGLGPDDVPKLTEQVRDSMLTTYQGISGMTNGASHQ
ncbi:PREDICTED: 1-acyl-sn-glycerol-3-phosphate acyltransferase alpha-like [Lepidothrix coronata]|uniref:1-acylglycerol-3-phosphate O-acyltransferase n=1 Tax=Lepidothrix coronata TaxID=321398 RepID=A0A6J0HZ08_9PASS|nr:PREDICTED: 1-acyl-sn-glycerol-3-phosphate acyltransferase alpha-like [Lepidothrix coronata]